MTEFKDGDLVDITIKGARVTNTYGTSRGAAGAVESTGVVLVYKHPDDEVVGSHVVGGAVNLSDPGVTVERCAPIEWPPQTGDLWRDRDGDLWLCRWWIDQDDQERTGMVCARRVSGKSALLGGSLFSESVLAKFGPLTLVHREEQS